MICSQARSDSPSVSSAQYRPIGSAFCIQTMRVASTRIHHREVLVAERAGLGVGDVGTERRTGTTVGDRHHRDVLLDEAGGLLVEREAGVGVGDLGGLG